MSNKVKAIPQVELIRDAVPGYAVSGTSQWERSAASGRRVDTKATRDDTQARQEWSRLDVMVKHEQQQVERLERRAAEARGTAKHAPICVRLQRTRALLTRLRNEQRSLVP